jgi:two-component system NarL family response regulator
MTDEAHHGISCLVADDHPALGIAVSAYLSARCFEVVGTVTDGAAAVALAAERTPRLAVVDYRMPRLSGCALLVELAQASPATKVAVYTAEADTELVAEALRAGAAAVVLKEAPLDDLVRALDAALAGRPYVDPGLAQAAMAGPGGRPALTERELDVLRLLAEGLSHDEIGASLSISGETVRTHVRKASERLRAGTRTQAVAAALRLKLIA